MKNLIERDVEVIEELPSRINRRRPSGYSNYGKNLPWNKVQRFLRSRVGKNWDNVYSEYVHLEWLPAQYRNLEQIGRSVILNTFMKDGKVWHFPNYSAVERPIEDHQFGNGCFYVHPETKVLSFQKGKTVNYKKLREKEEAKTIRIIGDYHQLINFSGIWYECKCTYKEACMYGNINNCDIWPSKKPFNSKDKLCRLKYTKRQLNKKELKKFSLKNTS